MRPAEFCAQLWHGHRVLACLLGVLLVANLVLALILQQYLVPTVDERERLLIERQDAVRGGAGETPAQLYAQGEQDLAGFRERIPPYRDFTGLIAELQGLAEEAGLELNQISYQHEQEKGADLLRYKLSFTVAGSYRDLKIFVHALEQSPRLIVVDQIGLQGVDADNEAEVRLQLNLETYFRPGVP